MGNRQLTKDELAAMFGPLLTRVREELRRLAADDDGLHWALRRKLAKELTYDERGKPMYRRALKKLKMTEQGNACAVCKTQLPARGAVLDRVAAMDGYTAANTRLLCPPCDSSIQHLRGYA